MRCSSNGEIFFNMANGIAHEKANEVFYLYLYLEDCRIRQEQNWHTKSQLTFSASNSRVSDNS